MYGEPTYKKLFNFSNNENALEDYCQPVPVAKPETLWGHQNRKETDVFIQFRCWSKLAHPFCGTILQFLPKLKILPSFDINFYWFQWNNHQ